MLSVAAEVVWCLSVLAAAMEKRIYLEKRGRSPSKVITAREFVRKTNFISIYLNE